MVEQLGLAMMPPSPSVMESTAAALTSGMQSGTPSVMRKAELLSTTCGHGRNVWGVLKHSLSSGFEAVGAASAGQVSQDPCSTPGRQVQGLHNMQFCLM